LQFSQFEKVTAELSGRRSELADWTGMLIFLPHLFAVNHPKMPPTMNAADKNAEGLVAINLRTWSGIADRETPRSLRSEAPREERCALPHSIDVVDSRIEFVKSIT
jgi:hypothetical protein